MLMFQNRFQAGERLAKELSALELPGTIVLAIPRGGVPVGSAVAKVLACPLDVIPLMKIPIPWSPDASYGVIAADGTIALNKPLINRLELSEREIALSAQTVLNEARQREVLYRRGRPFPDLAEKNVIVVDDGLGSGYSMLAAVDFVKKRNPGAVIAAAPAGSDMACRLLAAHPEISKLVVLVRDQEQVFSLAAYFKEFPSVNDGEVVGLLSSARG